MPGDTLDGTGYEIFLVPQDGPVVRHLHHECCSWSQSITDMLQREGQGAMRADPGLGELGEGWRRGHGM